ncbi:MAG: hypothetical protein QHJ73_10365, partial [Armatimonadota bacterium]|nr:hypothetical protein [Armatimonadota bacterium]
MTREATITCSTSPWIAGADPARLSECLGEPHWLCRRRQEAWETFQSLPWPDAADEEWRHVPMKELSPDGYAPPAAHGTPPAAHTPSLQSKHYAAGLVRYHADGVEIHLRDDLRQQGVLFTTLHDAACRYPDLVQQHLGRAIPSAAGKFEALHGAYWSGGLFLHVPAGVEVSAPFRAGVLYHVPGGALFPRLLVVAGAGSAFTLVEEHASPHDAQPAFASPLAEVIVGDGAR